MSSRRSDGPTEFQERKICELYQDGVKMSDVGLQVGFCVTTVKRVLTLHNIPKFKRSGRASFRDKYDDSALIEFKTAWDRLDSTVKGSICEGYAKLKLSELGFDVWEPTCQNHRTDFVVLSGSGLKRIQVKAGTYDRKTKSFRANFSRHQRGKRKEYDPEDVDFFMVYCAGMPSFCMYVIPAERLRVKNKCPRLFPHRDRFSNQPGKSNLECYQNAFHLIGESLSR